MEKYRSNEKTHIHKILGAGIGWVIGGPVGAALGLLVGHTVQNNPELLDKGLLPTPFKAHCDALQVPYDAGPEQVKTAYKQLAHKYHPDRFVEADPVIQELAQAKMVEINEAYRKIMDRLRSGTA
jgi:DnaJ-domain-containing protein 1